MKNFIICFIFMILPVMAEPTESREWISTSGTKVTGSAQAMANGKVTIKLADRTITVPVDKLSKADQDFLAKHFGSGSATPAAPAVSGGDSAYVTEGLSQKIGEVVGPIDAGGGSHYFLYIPKTLRKGRLAPLLHYNGATGGNAGAVKKHIEGAELNGWIVAACVESKNGPLHPVGNHAHAKRCVEHLTETLPVDPKRVYFTGGSGGGAMTFYNASKMKAAGGLPHIGYIPQEVSAPSGHFFVINGTTDYNRYVSAQAVKILGKNAIHRFFVGPHQLGPDWLCTEGMVWLNGKFLAKNKQSGELAKEALDYEASVLNWIKTLSEKEPHRAYYWCLFLKNDYSISGTNKASLDALTSALAGKPECASYVKGIEALSDFSAEVFSKEGSAALFQHTTPKIEKAAQTLADEYAGVPMIEDIAKSIGTKTCGQ